MEMLLMFVASLTLLTAGGLWLAVQLARAKMYRYLFIAVPLMLLAAVCSYFTIVGTMGWPTTTLPDEVQMLDYRTNGKLLWVWAVPKGGTKPRTFELPYTKKGHEELEQGKQKIGKGGTVMLKKPPKKNNNDEQPNGSGGDLEAPFVHHDFVPVDSLPPKDTQEQQLQAPAAPAAASTP